MASSPKEKGLSGRTKRGTKMQKGAARTAQFLRWTTKNRKKRETKRAKNPEKPLIAQGESLKGFREGSETTMKCNKAWRKESFKGGFK